MYDVPVVSKTEGIPTVEVVQASELQTGGKYSATPRGLVAVGWKVACMNVRWRLPQECKVAFSQRRHGKTLAKLIGM